MAPILTKWILITFLSLVMKPQILLIHAQPQVPCLFFFGDSLLDNGNNNALITLAKANYRPYGIDNPDGHPTGKFSNGQNLADFIAQFLGFINSIPPFANARGSDILRGVNYASGASGILEDSGINLGDRISLDRQLLNHQITRARLPLLLRNNGTTTTTNAYLNQCLYTVVTGNNDYINNYLLPQSLTRRLYTPDRFAEILIQKFSRQLRTLYSSGARKVAVFGLGILGCIPQELSMFPVNASGCVDFVNNAVQLFNNKLRPLIDQLNSDLNGAQFIYINSTSISSGDPSVIGIRVVNAPCCVVDSTGQCARNTVPCNNRNEYAFYDNFHPTELLNFVTALRAYNASSPFDAYPVDIRRLAAQ